MVVHCYPVNDIRPHITDGFSCLCGPKVERHGSGAVVVHNSFDGREFLERGIDYSERARN